MRASCPKGIVSPEHDSVEHVGSEKLEHHRRVQPENQPLGGRGVIIGERQHTSERTKNVFDQLIKLRLFGVVLPSECRRNAFGVSARRADFTYLAYSTRERTINLKMYSSCLSIFTQYAVMFKSDLLCSTYLIKVALIDCRRTLRQGKSFHWLHAALTCRSTLN